MTKYSQPPLACTLSGLLTSMCTSWSGSVALEPLAKKGLLVILFSRQDLQTGRDPINGSLKGLSFTSLFILSRPIWPNLKCYRYVSLLESV